MDAFKNRVEAIALYRYRRKGQGDYAYVVCNSQDDINEILNSKFVEQKTVEKLMGL